MSDIAEAINRLAAAVEAVVIQLGAPPRRGRPPKSQVAALKSALASLPRESHEALINRTVMIEDPVVEEPAVSEVRELTAEDMKQQILGFLNVDEPEKTRRRGVITSIQERYGIKKFSDLQPEHYRTVQNILLLAQQPEDEE